MPADLTSASTYRHGEPLPDTLFDMLRACTGREYPQHPHTAAEFAAFAAVCNYSFVASLVQALRCSPLIDLADASSAPAPAPLRVHIVGAHSEVVLFTQTECWLLTRWLPDRHRCIDLRFVGPDVPAQLDASELEYQYGRRRVRCRFDRVRYEHMDAGVPGWTGAPDMCVAFNAGLTEHVLADNQLPGDPERDVHDAANPWLPAVERIVRTCRLLALTAYVFDENKEDFRLVRRVLRRAGGQEPIIHAVGLNHYRDYRPWRDPMCHWKRVWSGEAEWVYYVNGHLSVLEMWATRETVEAAEVVEKEAAAALYEEWREEDVSALV